MKTAELLISRLTGRLTEWTGSWSRLQEWIICLRLRCCEMNKKIRSETHKILSYRSYELRSKFLSFHSCAENNEFNNFSTTSRSFVLLFSGRSLQLEVLFWFILNKKIYLHCSPYFDLSYLTIIINLRLKLTKVPFLPI